MVARSRHILAGVAVCTLLTAGAATGITVHNVEREQPGERGGVASDAVETARCASLTAFDAQLTCYETHFAGIQRNLGTATAIERLVELHGSSIGANFRTHCHEVLHTLGEQAVSSDIDSGGDGTAAFDDLAVTCTGGYAHGAISAWFDTLDGTDILERTAQLCPTLVDTMRTRSGTSPDATAWLEWNCDHMLGHAIYERSGPDYQADVERCAVFDVDTIERRHCSNGFFMEHFLRAGRDPSGTAAAGLGDSLEDLFDWCSAVDDDVDSGCWAESGGLVYQRAGFDWAVAADGCLDLGRETAVDSCLEGLGRNVAPYSGFDVDEMRAGCRQLGADRAVDACLVQVGGAAAMELGDRDGGMSLCADIGDTETRAICVDSVEGTIAALHDTGLGGAVSVDWERGR